MCKYYNQIGALLSGKNLPPCLHCTFVVAALGVGECVCVWGGGYIWQFVYSPGPAVLYSGQRYTWASDIEVVTVLMMAKLRCKGQNLCNCKCNW